MKNNIRVPALIVFAFFIGSVLMPCVLSFEQSKYLLQENFAAERPSTIAASSTNYYAVIAACSQYENESYDLPKPFLSPFSDKKISVLYTSLLEAKNWNASNIILLLNNNATKQNISDALVHMASIVGPNDIFLFSWSGHGTEVNDTDGDESRGGANDTKDEAICPYDVIKVDNYTKLNILTDDELGRYFSNISCKGMCLIFDCCLSGDMVDRTENVHTTGVSQPSVRASAFSEGFCEDLTGPQSADVNGSNRVILMSTKAGLLERGSYLTGFPFAFGLAFACSHTKLTDRNRDGVVSAEEAFRIARPLEYVQSAIFWIALWPYFYAFNVIHSWLLALLEIPFEYVLVQLVMKEMEGHYYGNFPIMQDTYEGQLPLIQV